jgi:hypothetical protein
MKKPEAKLWDLNRGVLLGTGSWAELTESIRRSHLRDGRYEVAMQSMRCIFVKSDGQIASMVQHMRKSV